MYNNATTIKYHRNNNNNNSSSNTRAIYQWENLSVSYVVRRLIYFLFFSLLNGPTALYPGGRARATVRLSRKRAGARSRTHNNFTIVIINSYWIRYFTSYTRTRARGFFFFPYHNTADRVIKIKKHNRRSSVRCRPRCLFTRVVYRL